VRPRVVLHHLGQIGMLLGVLGIPPVLVALIAGSWSEAAVHAGVATTMAVVGRAASRRFKADGMQENEALVITAGGFVLAATGAAVSMSSAGLGAFDAIFEAVSGVTTTGLTVVADPGSASASLRFNRAWAQWYGGLGFVTLASAMLGRGHLVNRIAGMEEDDDDPLGGMRAHGRRVLAIYVVLTVGGVVALWVLGAGPFDALLHALAAVSTGGFSSSSESLSAFGVPVRVAVLVLCVLGAMSFVTIHRTVRDSWKTAIEDVQLRSLLAMVGLAAMLVFLFEWLAGSASGAAGMGNALATAASAQSTAGFSTWSVGSLTPASKIVLLGAMFVGGSVGSSAGGLKQARFLMVLGTIRRRVIRTGMPRRAVWVPRIAGQKIEPEEARRILGLAFGWVLLIGTVWLAFAAFGYAPLDALFDVVSATATVGLSTGVVSAGLEVPLKLLLAVAMLVGRLELIAMLVLVAPGTWIGRRRSTS